MDSQEYQKLIFEIEKIRTQLSKIHKEPKRPEDFKQRKNKFWAWHKKRVEKAISTYDLDYYEMVEEIIEMANENLIYNWQWKRIFEYESMVLKLRLHHYEQDQQRNDEFTVKMIEMIQRNHEENKILRKQIEELTNTTEIYDC